MVDEKLATGRARAHAGYLATAFQSDHRSVEVSTWWKGASDVRLARGAGSVFEKAGRLIRPSQDCSVSYGFALILN